MPSKVLEVARQLAIPGELPLARVDVIASVRAFRLPYVQQPGSVGT